MYHKPPRKNTKQINSYNIMETFQLLPDNILHRQVCQSCFQYLSVPPITVNNRGETICGRCFDTSDKSYQKSTYNVLAERFLFKCTNHFNGCTKILNLAETKKHEETCSYKKQECFFCSFSGNLSQIVNHSLKFHAEHVSFDGKFSFWLGDTSFKNIFLYLSGNNIFHVTINVIDDLFTATILPAAKTFPSTINLYGVKFFRHNDPLNFEFIHTDYGLLNVSLVNYYEKNIRELVTFFEPEIHVCCQILFEQLSLDDKEVEFQRRFAKLRQSEVALNNLKQKVTVQEQELSKEKDVYSTAMSIIKKISYNLFKCSSCEKIILKDTYYCLKMHCYCRNCLNSMCKICHTMREFKKLEDIDSFIVACDWPRCNIQLRLKDYLEHKSKCSERPYKCPSHDCQEVLFSSKRFYEHWHSKIPALVCADSIVCKEYEKKEFYWLLNHDLYRILINFSESWVQVLIDEINVLPNNNSFKCRGSSKEQFPHIFEASDFGGAYHINVLNSFNYSDYYTKATTIQICPN